MKTVLGIAQTNTGAGRVEFHRHVHADGTMTMPRQDAVDLAPGTTK